MYLLCLFTPWSLEDLNEPDEQPCIHEAGGAVYSNNTGASDGWRTIRPRRTRPSDWPVTTGLMTTTASSEPIRARLGPRSVFVNDVMSVEQDGAVLSTNRWEWVYPRRSLPLGEAPVLFYGLSGNRVTSAVRYGCCGRRWTPQTEPAGSWSFFPLRRAAPPLTAEDGRRRVHVHHGEHGHDFSGVRGRVHAGGHRRWVVWSLLLPAVKCWPVSAPSWQLWEMLCLLSVSIIYTTTTHTVQQTKCSHTTGVS